MSTRDDLLNKEGEYLSPFGEAMLEWYRNLPDSEQEACANAVDEIVKIYRKHGRKNGIGMLAGLELFGIYLAHKSGILRQMLWEEGSGR